MHSHEATAEGLPRNAVQARVAAEGAVPNFVVVGCAAVASKSAYAVFSWFQSKYDARASVRRRRFSGRPDMS